MIQIDTTAAVKNKIKNEGSDNRIFDRRRLYLTAIKHLSTIFVLVLQNCDM
jgi:hypothetical protein